jgi:hypothetical protein
LPITPKPNSLESTIELEGGAAALAEGAIVGPLGFEVEDLGGFLVSQALERRPSA